MSRIDAITLRGIAVHGYHGVFPEERRDGQLFVVDVELQLVLETRSDSLSDTVNYGEIAALVERVVAGEPCNLIETVAGRIAEGILAQAPKVEHVRVVVHKPQAPVPQTFQDISVTINRSQHGERTL